jgi:hypothetical protein
MDTEIKTEGRAIPWNKGKLLGQKPPLKLKEIWAIRIRLQLTHQSRELALFNLALDTKLRGRDLVGLHVHDLVQGSRVASRAIVMQKKLRPPFPQPIMGRSRPSSHLFFEPIFPLACDLIAQWSTRLRVPSIRSV